jgi:hypothetical protein
MLDHLIRRRRRRPRNSIARPVRREVEPMPRMRWY